MKRVVKKYLNMPDSFTVAKTCNNCEHRNQEMCKRYEHFIGYVRARDRTCYYWAPNAKYWKDMKLVMCKRDKENPPAKGLL
jgi:hypothetical protein